MIRYLLVNVKAPNFYTLTKRIAGGTSDNRVTLSRPEKGRLILKIKVRMITYLVAATRKTGGSADGYKPLLLKASVSRRWLSLCSSHCAFHSSRIPKGIAPTQIRT